MYRNTYNINVEIFYVTRSNTFTSQYTSPSQKVHKEHPSSVTQSAEQFFRPGAINR